MGGWKISDSAGVIRAAGQADLPEVRRMMAEYQQWLGVDLSFQQFAHEVATLPGDYAPPTGALFVACRAADAIGMVALRRIDDGRSEMKRLFVRPVARGSGLGRVLAARVIDEARTLGYSEIVLDTLPVMYAAHRLYASLGFQPIPPYYASPIAGTTFMSLPL